MLESQGYRVVGEVGDAASAVEAARALEPELALVDVYLQEAGFEVVAHAGDAEELVRRVSAHKPDVAVVDIRMPPTETDDGLRAAIEIRRRLPETGVIVLSQYLEKGPALDPTCLAAVAATTRSPSSPSASARCSR